MAADTPAAQQILRDSQPEPPTAPQMSKAQIYFLQRKRQKQRLGVIPRG